MLDGIAWALWLAKDVRANVMSLNEMEGSEERKYKKQIPGWVGQDLLNNRALRVDWKDIIL